MLEDEIVDALSCRHSLLSDSCRILITHSLDIIKNCGSLGKAVILDSKVNNFLELLARCSEVDLKAEGIYASVNVAEVLRNSLVEYKSAVGGVNDLRLLYAVDDLGYSYLDSGVDAKTLSGILGHTNASFTLDTYTHVTTDMQKHACEIVGSFIDEFMVV